MPVQAEVWLVDASAVGDADLLRYRGWLGDDELARYQGFVRPLRQRQFLVGRALLRLALGRLLAVAPQEIHLAGRQGQPRLIAPSAHAAVYADAGLPGFSISHSGPWVACAVSMQTALGLDIELKDASRDLDALALQAFDADETARWLGWKDMPEPQRRAAFYQLWSEKEARFKLGADGPGHCIALPHQDLSLVLCSAQALAAPPCVNLALPA
jgi:4'-phosphopantetheinyl transferase